MTSMHDQPWIFEDCFQSPLRDLPQPTALGNLPVSKSVGSLNGDNGASWDSEFNYNPKPKQQ